MNFFCRKIAVPLVLARLLPLGMGGMTSIPFDLERVQSRQMCSKGFTGSKAKMLIFYGILYGWSMQEDHL
jgi:hypothetical protein